MIKLELNEYHDMIKIANIEKEDSWPHDLSDLLGEKVAILTLYMKKQVSYSELSCQEKNRFSNNYQGRYEDIINKIENILSGYFITGYHCTRLLSSEIESIKNNGLEPLSQEFLEKKLYLAVYKNEITFEIATHILKNNLSEEIGRKGMLHFTCSLSSLNEEDGVSKFFKAWGGEAIYNVHENDSFSWEAICKIGQASIIEVALSPNDIFNCGRIWDKFIDTFLENRNISTENGKGTDARIEYSLPSERILDIITVDSHKFLELTNYDSWRFQR